MIVNQEALRGVYTGYKVIFQKAFEENTPKWNRIATHVPSATGEEAYKWLGAFPQMREWLGDRVINNLEASDYTIINKNFELTVGVPRDAIEDDKIGLYGPMIESLGQSAAQHPDTLVFGLLPGGFTQKCYDGKFFFSDKHEVGSGKDKKIVSNTSKLKLTPQTYRAARAAIMSLTNDSGQPLNLVPDLLVVSPKNEEMGKRILEADLIGGSSNTDKGTAELHVSTQLAGKNEEAWYLLVTTRPIKPLIFQQRTKVKFVSLTNESDENVFMSKKFLYGADYRGNSGYAFWQMAFGSTGEEDPAAPVPEPDPNPNP